MNIYDKPFEIAQGKFKLFQKYVKAGEIKFRLPLFSLFYLETKEIYPSDIPAEGSNNELLVEFLQAAIVGSTLNKLTADGKTTSIISDFDLSIFNSKETAQSILRVFDENVCRLLVSQTIQLALPEPIIGFEESETEETNTTKGIDYKTLRTLYCDVMKRSDIEFWNSTLREITERWDKYAEIKGYKEPTQVIKQYDKN